MSDFTKYLHKKYYRIDKYDDEPYTKNPLLQFQISAIKERRHSEYIKRKAAAVKLKMCRNGKRLDLDEDIIPIPQSVYVSIIHKFVDSSTKPTLLKSTEQEIFNFIPENWRKKYPQIVTDYMLDVSNDFNKIIGAYSSQKIVIPFESDYIPECMQFSFKYLGKSKRYHVFVENRQKIRDTLFIAYPFARLILSLSKTGFPPVLNDYGRYTKNQNGQYIWMTLAEFESTAQKDLENNAMFLRDEWYPKVVKIIRKFYKRRLIAPQLWQKALNCAKGLINRQLTELKIDTFEHVFDVLNDRNRTPYFIFQANYSNNNITLYPSITDVQNTFKNIFQSVLSVGKKLASLEQQIDRNAFDNKELFLKIEISATFMDEMYRKLEETIRNTYKPIVQYIDILQGKFYYLYSEKTRTDLSIYLADAKSYDEYLKKIESFQAYVVILQKMVQNEYFNIAMINQSKAIVGLRTITMEYIQEIADNIVNEHYKECTDICNWFESVQRRAYEVPTMTETLLSNGEFMLKVKTKHMFELHDRIQSTLKVSGILIDLTDLSPAHRDIQIQTVKWIDSMNDIFEQNATQFELYKNQFEEQLGAVTKKLIEDIDALIPKLAIIDDMSETDKLRNYYSTLKIYNDQINCFENYIQWINKEEKLFKLPVSHYPVLEELKNYVIPFAALVKLSIDWLRYYYIWMDGPFEYLEPNFIDKSVKFYEREFEKTQKYYRNRIKQDMLGNPILKFRGQTEDPDPEKHPVPLRLCGRKLEWIKGFQIGVYIVKIMCNSALRDRHWVEMSQIAGYNIAPDAGTSLRKIIAFKLDDKLPSFEIISIGANKELQLQNDLAAMIKQWDNIEFPICVYKDSGINILASLDDIQVLLDDHIIKTLTMRGSAFVKPCEIEVRLWYDKLLRVSKLFDEWANVQISWLSLLPLFSTEDIRDQMPKETALFDEVDRNLCNNIKMIIEKPTIMETVDNESLLDGIQISNQNLELIKSGVNAYLENKREYFPRFFFMSNNEMLQILSETKNPLNVQPYLSKCFEGIHRLDFDESFNIHAMNSICGEHVNFVNKISTVDARGCVEKWLERVETEMIAAIQNETKHSYSDFITTDWCQWITNWPQMIVLCISQIFWASDVHCALKNNDVASIRGLCSLAQTNIEDSVACVLSSDTSNLDRITLRSLIVTEEHAKSVMLTLMSKCDLTENDFDWVAQLKYYWANDQISTQILNTRIPFGNEYIGNSDRLVVTPITDRCRRSLIVAIRMRLNLCVEGPASVGKTETIKDISKALATQCRVFNCSEDLHHSLIGRFIIGLSTCGAWACFDNFNRINVEVLSIITEQIRALLHAASANSTQFSFEGKRSVLNSNCFICITLNPEYPRRYELPINLKVLFRPISMTTPDIKHIVEVILVSFGFSHAKALSGKIMGFYQFCADLLSSQAQYDFGLYNIKSMLVLCGNTKLLRQLIPEDELIAQCLMNVMHSKLLGKDIPVFEGILHDVFPGTVFNQNQNEISEYDVMNEIYVEKCNESNLQPADALFSKLVQMYEVLQLRQSIILIGDPFSGKSVMIKLLSEILELLNPDKPLHRSCKLEFISPKSMTLEQLFGEFDTVSHEWVDGVIATTFRNFANDESDDNKWLILDGPLDPIWMENLSTAMDENRNFSLASGEMIHMTSQMSFIFETKNLTDVSPATISRCGIIYMEPKTLSWEAFVTSWASKCNPKWMSEHKQIILDLVKWIMPQATSFVLQNCTTHLWTGEINILITTLDIFQMVMDEAVEANADDYQKFLVSWIQAAMIYSTAWGVGGLLTIESRDKFDQFHKKMWCFSEENPPPASIQNRLDITLPTEGNLCEYVYIFKQKGGWKYWADLVRRQEPEVSPLGIQVVTVDTGRYSMLLEMHVKYKKKMLLVGPSGTGKTCLFQHVLINKLNSAEYHPTLVALNVSSSASEIQELLMSNVIKLRRGVFGPPKGKTCVLFADDLNRPMKDEFGAQTSVELLRQLMNYSFLFDIKNRKKIYLEDVLVAGSCGISNDHYSSICRRFLSHFNCFAINKFSEDSVHRIFSYVLMHGFKKGGHSADVINQVNQIVSATLKIYYSALNVLKVTATKCHYVFNLHDLSRLCAGCAMLRKESVDNKRMFAKVWFHESMRTFHDRLINDEDRHWIFQQISNATMEFFKDALDQILELYQNDDGELTLQGTSKLIFGTYCHIESGDIRYEEMPSWNKFTEIVQSNLDEYNASHRIKLNIVLFSYALQHLNRICRIISIPSGSGLLIGLGDSGRRSLTQIAAFMCKQSLFQPDVSQGYEFQNWREDVKTVLKASGGTGNNAIFLVSDNEITHEGILTDIGSLLSTGEIPNLWPVDEKQEVLEMVRLDAQGGNRNIDVSPAQVFSFFVNRSKQKLHIILCFSPIGNTLRNRLIRYPSLLNCCTVDWFDDWPTEALVMVSRSFLSDIKMPEETMSAVIESSVVFHQTAKLEYERFFNESGHRNYVTTAAYLELHHCFKKLYENKQQKIADAIRRYTGGLNTLVEATEAVNSMQTELNLLHPKLLTMAKNLSEMAVEIEAKTREANVATDHVRREQEIANEQTASAEAMEKECLQDLAQAVPVLEDALQALNTLKPADITLVKSMKNPPSAVKLVMAAVCVMKGVPPDRINDPSTGKKIVDYWGPSKRILGDMGFLQSLKDYDKDDISPDIMKKIRKDFIPHKDFQPHIVAKASSAAEGLCKWIQAIENFESVNTVVQPKKLKLQNAKSNLKATKKVLAEKRRAAAALEAKVMGLNKDLETANSEKRRTEEEVQMCNGRLKRAEELISGLGGEKSRWTKSTQDLQSVHEHLIGDVLIASAIISYLAPLNLPLRKKCIKNWHELCKQLLIPCSDEFKVAKILASDIQIQHWTLDGLSKDEFSVGNAIILNNSYRFCLLVDPQHQANLWIRKSEQYNKLKVLKFTHINFVPAFQQCVRFGQPLLIEAIGEHLEASIEPVLHRHVFQHNGEDSVVIAGEIIPWNENFRLYLTSHLKNPLHLPETCNKVNIVNFALTQKGLEQQLLDILISKERPDLQEQREKLIEEFARNQSLLKEYENNILKTIARSRGRILEDHSAVREMNELKQSCVEMGHRLDATKLEQDKIKKFRDIYKPVAIHAAVIFDCLKSLHSLCPMYQFSLIWYMNVYRWSIENANKSQEIDRRIHFLKLKMTNSLFSTVSRSLYKNDKLLFSWLLTTRVMLASNAIDAEEYSFFIKCQTDHEVTICEAPYDWLPNNIWKSIQHLTMLPKFSGLIHSLQANTIDWRQFYEFNGYTTPQVPHTWTTELDQFQQLILIRIFHPSKVAQAIREFVAHEMGSKFAYPSYFDISKPFDESTILTPILILLSEETDPIETLLHFARRRGYAESLGLISLGKDMGKKAAKIIAHAQMQGSWVCLQNCHLTKSWLSMLESIWEDFNIRNTKSTFRLWLTCKSVDFFPHTLLENCVKVSCEEPNDLKQNLLKIYDSEPVLSPTYYNGCPGKDRAFSRLLYSTAFFHAIIQNRKNFGSMGWNNVYNFHSTDFRTSVHQLQQFINQYSSLPYTALFFLIGECSYGGRICDEWDRQTLLTILSDYINERVVNEPLYQFASNNGHDYILPRRPEHREIRQYIKTNIPMADASMIYGFHEYSSAHLDLEKSIRLMDAIVQLPCDVHEKNSMFCDADDGVFEYMKDIHEKLPSRFDTPPILIDTNPFEILLQQEMQRFNVLLEEVETTCQLAENIIKGTVKQTPHIEGVFNEIRACQIPKCWLAKSYLTAKPLGSYIFNLNERIKWFRKWKDHGQPDVLWISSFFNVRAVISATLQVSSRKQRIPLTEITFDIRILDVSETILQEDGIRIMGVYIQNARWNSETHKLSDQRPKIGLDTMPDIYVYPLLLDRRLPGSRFDCPLYRTLKRAGSLTTSGQSANFITTFLLDTEIQSSIWIKRGAALIIESDN